MSEKIAMEDSIWISTGSISGTLMAEAGVRIYCGIPYAAPPVGALRWRPPQPVRSWEGIRECTAMSKCAPQAIGKVQMYHEIAQSEDCLYLNVLSPASRAEERLPVMVWLHGGAYIHGNSNEPFFNSPRLPSHGVVLVNVTMRLGPIGQMAHPLLTKESSNGSSGNYMTLDMIAALKWIQQNISAFGGDPDNVTIFGESGGGAKVLTLMCTPLAKRLFHKAIVQSGGVFGTLNGSPLKENEAVGQAFFRRLGVNKEPDPLAAARAKPWEEIMKADAELVAELDLTPFRWDVTIDDYVLSDTTPNLIKSGRAANVVPFIAGCNLGEIDGTGFPMINFPSMVPYYVSLYLDARRQGIKSYAYLYDHVPHGWRKDGCVSFHRLEPGYVFGDWDDKYGFFKSDAELLARVSGAKQMDPELGEVDRRVSENMMELWTHFARTSDPAVPGLTDWPTYDPSADAYLSITDRLEVRKGFSKLVD